MSHRTLGWCPEGCEKGRNTGRSSAEGRRRRPIRPREDGGAVPAFGRDVNARPVPSTYPKFGKQTRQPPQKGKRYSLCQLLVTGGHQKSLSLGFHYAVPRIMNMRLK